MTGVGLVGGHSGLSENPLTGGRSSSWRERRVEAPLLRRPKEVPVGERGWGEGQRSPTGSIKGSLATCTIQSRRSLRTRIAIESFRVGLW